MSIVGVTTFVIVFIYIYKFGHPIFRRIKIYIKNKIYSKFNMKKIIDGVEHNILPMDKYRELINENLKLKTHVEELTKPKLKTTSKEYHQEYYKKNKERLKTNASLKVPCPKCNKMIQKQHMSKHKKTQKCMLHDEMKTLKNQHHT